MTKQFLVTFQTPGEVPIDRLDLIQDEICNHAAACVEFYGRQRPELVKVCDIQDVLRTGKLVPLP